MQRLERTPQAPQRAARTGGALATLSLALASAALLTLAGCANPGGIAPVAQPLTPAALGLAPATAAAAPEPALAGDWWRAFGDPALDRLVTTALAQNPGLKAAQARVARAEAVAAGARAAEGPQVGLSADTTRQRFSATSIYPPPLGGSLRTLANLQAGASYEFDFFGRNRAAIEAAVGATRAAQAEAQAARIVLASDVARAYVQLARVLAQREVAERALAQRSELLTLIRARVDGGLDSVVELRQGEGALPEARLQIEALDEQATLLRHMLAALSAQPPEALAALKPPLRVVQAVPLPTAVPADLLGRRADISAARWRIEAAGSEAQAARAAFYPNVNLSAFAGLASVGLDRLFKSASEQYGAGPALHLPLFDSGRLRANLRGKTAELDAAVESYNGAVLEAVHQAADQIASLQSLQRQQAEQRQAQESAEAAWQAATQRYRAGLSTYLTVLNAEAAVLAQRRAEADLKARTLDAQIGLIRALGGGWAPA